MTARDDANATAVEEAVRALQIAVDHAFARPEIAAEALVHGSLAHEERIASNERLEFLGDAVLQLCVTSLLYASFPRASEGELHMLRKELVRTEHVASIARTLGLPALVRTGKGQGALHSEKMLADTCEAVIGALFVDGGLAVCEPRVRAWFGPALEKLAAAGADRVKDACSRLQEFTQSRRQGAPDYVQLDVRGPDHARVFAYAVTLGGKELGRGEGASIKAAKHAAAQKALELLADAANDATDASADAASADPP